MRNTYLWNHAGQLKPQPGIRSGACSDRIVRAQGLRARLCRIRVNQHEDKHTGLRAVIDPGMHRAAVYHYIALPDAQHLAVVQF